MNKQFIGYNDLHNTYSAKHHVPAYKGKFAYKGRYENQLSINKGLLIALGLTVVTSLAIVVGTTLRFRAELGDLQLEISKRDGYIETSNQSYNELVEIVTNTGTQTPEQIINTVFGKDAPLMIKVAKCESMLNAKAKNKNSSATGLFQILSYTHNVNARYLEDPMINALIAKKLFDASGTNPWVSSISCWGK